MTEKSINQSGQTVQGNQVNAGGDLNVEQIGDRINTTGGDYIVGDKIAGDIVVTGQVAGNLVINYGTQPTTTLPPPHPLRPPEVELFIGREDTLTYYEKTIAQSGLAVISGMPGIGKTALAATLARRLVARHAIFWHVFHEGQGLETVIWRLAGFLATQGQDEVWRMVQGSQSTPPDILLDYLIHHLRGRNFLICLDDFQYVEEDPRLNDMVARLRPLLANGSLSLIVTSRQMPKFVKDTAITFLPLEGIDSQAVRHLLAANDIFAEPEVANQLHRYTGGNATLLTLAVDLLQGGYNPDRLVENLIKAEDVKDFLIDEIEDQLSRSEIQVLAAVSVLHGYPGSQASLKAILDGRRLDRILRDLSKRFLLTVTRTEDDVLYGIHAILQDYFYEAIHDRERPRMHRRAGVHYRDAEPDVLLAARHFFLAGVFTEAADLVTPHTYELINKAEARQLSRLLNRFEYDQLDPHRWVAVKRSLGQVHAYFGENDQARLNYDLALEEIARLPDSAASLTIQANLFRLYGEFLTMQSPADAITWFERGLSAVKGVESFETSALQVGLGTAYMFLNQHDKAQPALLQGLNSLPPEPSQLKVTALENLSVILAQQGKLETGLQVAHQALTLSNHLNDLFKVVEITSTIGSYHFANNDWKSAVTHFEQALNLSRELGNEKIEATAAINLGSAMILLGDDEKALQYLTRGLDLARKTEQTISMQYALLNLTELFVLQQDWSAAKAHLKKGEKLTRELGNEVDQPRIWRLIGEIALGENKTDHAVSAAAKSLTLSENLDEADPIEVALSLELEGRIGAATGNDTLALKKLRESLDILQELAPYEAARCKTSLAEVLLTSDSIEEGGHLLNEARETFVHLSAERDLAHIKSLITLADLG